MDNDKEHTQVLIIEPKKNYGSAANATDVAWTTKPLQQQRSVIYCVHGKLAQSCCELPDDLNIRKIESHCHRPRTDGVDKVARKKLIIASVLCVIFMIAEIIGGVYSNSLAIATDAAHLLADLASFMISLFALWIAARPSTKRLSFGWHRAEVIGALTSVLMIWVVTAILFYMAIMRTIERNFELDGKVMLITSGLGILVNIIMGATLHTHGHSHSSPSLNDSKHASSSNGHSHSHSHNHNEGYTEENINVRAAFIHVLSDFVQSLGVFIAALVIYFKPEWSIIDPVCTFLFSILVLATTIAIMKDALLVLMEGTPKYLDYTEVMQVFLQIEGVVRVHNLRIWALSINKIALSAHLAVAPNTNTEAVLQQATRSVHAKYDFFETTLQIEEFQADMEDCNQCTNPM
ncbi:proton-coupled zinc antiporter SLC30A2-like [Topomyia yanbarensis]|uniref:proton-coupled zinc antiporter SLC30A2-like n=1 Tax=Topomyia yanbarensis TaxID=2498891 RepID=UPI00273CDE66|nr:proton-coupled zinc antiporter SLC30A2-like [Topomyia yanbarensis]